MYWHPTPVLLPGKSHGRRSLVGCSPWGRKESGTTERLHFHFSLSCIGEGNGNPLQCSCLENRRDGGAWWAAVYGVAQSWTRLKRLSSSSSSSSSDVLTMNTSDSQYSLYCKYLPDFGEITEGFWDSCFEFSFSKQIYLKAEVTQPDILSMPKQTFCELRPKKFWLIDFILVDLNFWLVR